MPPPSSGRILVVDDNEDLAQLFAALIELMGYDTRAVFSAEAALAILPAYAPDVVFSDIGMPRMSGYDLARAIRGASPAQPLLVAVSGWADAATVDAARQAGFDLHLGKPVMYEQVRTLLQEHFQISGTRR